MSDADVLRSIEVMEAWLRNPLDLPDADGMAAWNCTFQAAVEGAERGPGWGALVVRAHALGVQVAVHTAELAVRRDQLRTELNAQELGGRALKGYSAAIR